MTIEDRRPSGSPPKANRQSIFQLSPVPATLPMPAISSIHATFNSLAEDSEVEDVRKATSHTHRSAQPIPIKSAGYPRHASMLSRNDPDSASQSVPRSLVDIQMGSCSSSPLISSDLKHMSAERQYEPVSQSITMQDSTNSLSRRVAGSSRRPSVSSHSSSNYVPQDSEGQRLAMKAQLRDLLDRDASDNEAPRPQPPQVDRKPPPRTISPPRPPVMAPPRTTSPSRPSVAPPRRTTSPETRRSTSPESSASVTRQPSPVSNSGSLDYPSDRAQGYSNGYAWTSGRVSHASAAAQQAERARQAKQTQAASAPPPPPQPAAPTYKDAGLQRDISNTYYVQQQQQQHTRPPFSRRPSDTSRGKPATSHPTVSSGLSRALWIAGEQPQAQRA